MQRLIALTALNLIFIAGTIGCQSAGKNSNSAVSANSSGNAAAGSQTSAKATPAKTIATEFGEYQAPDETKVEQAQVILIPQWHFSPQVNTKRDSIKQPQFENQFSIFKETEDLYKKGVATLIVEGCEGEIKDGFTPVLNGWSLKDVKKTLKDDGNIDLVMTHVGLKAEAQYGEKMAVKCGDNFALIEKNLGTLSDIRGYIGFKIRIEQLKDDPKTQAGYLATLKKVLKLPPETSDKDAQKILDTNLRQNLREYKKIINDRNAYFVEAAKKNPGRKSIVIGALHVPDLEKRLQKEKISYVVFRPKGLDKAGGDPVEALQKIFGE